MIKYTENRHGREMLNFIFMKNSLNNQKEPFFFGHSFKHCLPMMSFLIASVIGIGLAASGDMYLVKVFTASCSIPAREDRDNFKTKKATCTSNRAYSSTARLCCAPKHTQKYTNSLLQINISVNKLRTKRVSITKLLLHPLVGGAEELQGSPLPSLQLTSSQETASTYSHTPSFHISCPKSEPEEFTQQGLKLFTNPC